MKVVWTAQAWERLLEIEMFIAQNAPVAATRLIDRLVSRADGLAHHPDRGRRLPEMPASGLREIIVGNYRIVYRRGSQVVEVMTVFEGHRLLRREELPQNR